MEKKNLLRAGTIGFLVGSAGVTGWECRGQILPNPDSVTITGNRLEFGSKQLNADKAQDFGKAIEVYQRAKGADGAVFQSMLANNPSEATITLAHQISRDYFDRGVAILQLKLPENIKPHFADPEGKILVFQKRQFNLTDLYQSHLAQALIDKSLEVYLPQDSSVRSRGSIVNQLNLLWWLKDQNINIRFEPDSFAFFDSDNMVTMAASLYYSQGDTPKPSVIQFYRLGDGRYPSLNQKGKIVTAGRYDCSRYQSISEEIVDVFDFDESRENCPVLISNAVDAADIAHEIGHHVGANSERLDQEEFKKRIETVMAEFESKVTEKSDIYLSEHAADNYMEDYAETFAQYIVNGAEFRQLLRQMRWWDYGSYKILSAKYQFFKERLGAREFLQNGAIADSIDLADRHDLAGKTFIVKEISTELFEPTGIGLRQIPTDLASRTVAKLSGGDIVKISEGPIIWGDSRTGETFTMYKVSAIKNVGHEITGWIAIEWLGEELSQPKEIPSLTPITPS